MTFNRTRKERPLDYIIAAALEHANGVFDPKTGIYCTLQITDLPSFAAARDTKNGLYASVKSYRVNGRYISMSYRIERKSRTNYTLWFTLRDKDVAKQYMSQIPREYWKYDKRAGRHMPPLTEQDV